MQQNGSGSRERQSFSPLPAVRRFLQDRGTLPRLMVLFSATAAEEDAMSTSAEVEEDFRKTAAAEQDPQERSAEDECYLMSETVQDVSGADRQDLVPGIKRPRISTAFPEVISLNVGGTYFTTRLSTLQRYEDSMLAAMFSGRHYIPRDAEGRFFIDRDGTYFGDILNFLREGELPDRDRVRSVYREAQFYTIGPLLDHLEDTQPLTGEKVRQAFLDLLPYYKDNLERIVEIARARAVQKKARFAKLKVCVYKEETPVTPYERPFFDSVRFERSDSESRLFEHRCEVDVSFGPWEAVADVYDLLHCIVCDLSQCGITAEHQCIGVCDKHLINHYYCKRPIYEFKITWW